MTITEKLTDFVREHEGSRLSERDALEPSLAGMRFYDAPLVGVASADDELFERLRRREAVGPWFRKPEEWLPGAKSVISFFLPYSDEVKSREDPSVKEPSRAWLHARIEGNAFLWEAARFLQRELEAGGYRAVIPTQEKGFFSVWAPGSSDRLPDPDAGFTSTWSERHVAFVCGLGTFGLSAGLITEKGVCGRFGSLVTDAALPVTPRRYTEIYEYCTKCAVCARHCPVQAIDPARGKCHALCGERLNETKRQYAPRYGCAKCQIGVPCMSGIPKK